MEEQFAVRRGWREAHLTFQYQQQEHAKRSDERYVTRDMLKLQLELLADTE